MENINEAKTVYMIGDKEVSQREYLEIQDSRFKIQDSNNEDNETPENGDMEI